MSETYFHYRFICLDGYVNVENITSQVEKIYKKARVVVSDLIIAPTASKPSCYLLDLKAEFNQKALKNTLAYLLTLPSLVAPYVKIEFDQVNDVNFYTIADNKLLSFSDENDLISYLGANEAPPIETDFYRNFSKDHSTLLVRLKISNKKLLNSFHDTCSIYIKEKSSKNYEIFKETMDAIVQKSMKWECDFPSYTHASQRYLGNPLFAKSMDFCEHHNGFLYLGFVLDNNINIEIYQEDNGAPYCIKNVFGKQLYTMLEMLWAVSQQGLIARFRSADFEKSNIEGYFSFVSGSLLYRERTVEHELIWQV